MKWTEHTGINQSESTIINYLPKEKSEIVEVGERPFKEAGIEKLNLSLLQSNLNNCLNIVEDEVLKGYITVLDKLPIVEFDKESYYKLSDIQFFRISELVYQEDEFSVDKLAMVFHALSNTPCTLVLMLKSDGVKTEFYLGVRPKGENSSGTLLKMLKSTLLGFFPGSKISQYYNEVMEKDMNTLVSGCISAVTCVADYKQAEASRLNKDFIQGLEKFVDAIKDRVYTGVFIADTVENTELTSRKHEYEQIYTQLSPFANMQINFTSSEAKSDSVSRSDGLTTNKTYTKSESISDTTGSSNTYTTAISEGVGKSTTDSKAHTDTQSSSKGSSHTVGSSDGISDSTSVSMSRSSSLSASMGGIGISGSMSTSTSSSHSTSHTDSVSDTISNTLSHGFSDSYGKSYGSSETYGKSRSTGTSESVGNTLTRGDSHTLGEAFNLVNSKALTDTLGSSKGISLNVKNMSLNLLMDKIDRHLKRIEECESFGMWNFAAYFFGETAAESQTAANIYKSVIAGSGSGVEKSAINFWDENQTQKLLPYIRNFLHPKFLYKGFSYVGNRQLEVNPSALVSTNELALHMGLPRYSVRGLPVVEHTAFAREVVKKDTGNDNINLGTVYDLGEKTNTQVGLDINSLSMHTFITGSTGSGKSNAVYHLLSEASKLNVPFLVIEPAKGEYRKVFSNVKYFGTNPLIGDILRIDPFSFPNEVHVLEHIDRIIEIFNVCWPMYGAMPAVLKDAVEKAYISAGWDLVLSQNIKVSGLVPSFEDVLRELNEIMNSSQYSDEVKGNYKGALFTRLASLTNGINGLIFVKDEVSLEELFDKSAIVDISRIGSTETKSLIMGLIVLKLQEYRMSKSKEMNLPLRHLTVMEEAHNLLKKTSTEQIADTANLVGKSVEMITNTIAEIRTYGEGFVIVDQAPNLLDTATIRNTNTKIVLRLPESNDRSITGGAMALKDRQYDELSKLPTGVAAVYQNDWQEAVLCALPKYEIQYNKVEDNVYNHVSAITKRKEDNDKLLHLLIKKEQDEFEVELIKELVKRSNTSAKICKDLIGNLSTRNSTYEWAVADFIKKNYELSNIFNNTQGGNIKSVEELCEIMILNIKPEFNGFSKDELEKITYFICRIEHELYPDNEVIEMLRVNYLKRRVM